eukprot:1160509-Pelagomonas_calceolata.AAC.6
MVRCILRLTCQGRHGAPAGFNMLALFDMLAQFDMQNGQVHFKTDLPRPSWCCSSSAAGARRVRLPMHHSSQCWPLTEETSMEQLGTSEEPLGRPSERATRDQRGLRHWMRALHGLLFPAKKQT